MGAWYDKKTAMEVVNTRLWLQLKVFWFNSFLTVYEINPSLTKFFVKHIHTLIGSSLTPFPHFLSLFSV